jgi:serine/threonine protein kinase
MTSVYAARSAHDDSPCAIKLLQREARAGLSVRHPHLVRILDAHVTNPPYYLALELLPGVSLRQRLRRDYRLPAREAIWIVRQMAEGLAALHAAGFLHGDIKPDNVRLTGDGTAVLLDLGFAHRPGENAALLDAGYILGTANYLAPEQCEPTPRADFKSDLFSLGVMLFEMLAGRLPYPAGSLHQTLRRHACDPPANIRESVGNLPAPLIALLERLLARRPEDRPAASSVVQHMINLEIVALRRRRAA